jgi:hypothetical protein
MQLQAVTHSSPIHPAVLPFEGTGCQGCASAPLLQKLELQVILGPSAKQGIDEPPNIVHKLHAHGCVIGVACLAVILLRDAVIAHVLHSTVLSTESPALKALSEEWEQRDRSHGQSLDAAS